MTEQAEALEFLLFQLNISNVSYREVPKIDVSSDYYNMNHNRRGTAIIFNHYLFDKYLKLKKRYGTFKDAEDLEDVLKKLKFDVTTYVDLKYEMIEDILYDLSETNHSDADCLLIVVLTHGDTDEIYAYDKRYSTDLLWDFFVGDRCPTLIGKPKLFFIQACRGKNVDDGTIVRLTANTYTPRDDGGSGLQGGYADEDEAENIIKIPSMADILIVQSSFDGYISWRNSENGSWFIQCLCLELYKRANENDLLTILTFVNKRLALFYQSNVPGNKEMNQKKQIALVKNSLTRLLCFYPYWQL